MRKNEKEPRWIDNLRILMKAKNFNPRSLSLKAGLGATAVRDALEGRTKFPRYDTVEALAQALKVTPAQLMGGKNIASESPEPLQDEDLDLLTEIITRLKEVIEERQEELGAGDFAAMVTSLYRQMRPPMALRKKPSATKLARRIEHLISYESLRRRQGNK